MSLVLIVGNQLYSFSVHYSVRLMFISGTTVVLMADGEWLMSYKPGGLTYVVHTLSLSPVLKGRIDVGWLITRV
jgi:hypothetical protein